MSTEQKFWTFGDMLDKVHADTDISEEDPDEQFVTFAEMIGYFNEGIDEAESDIHKIDEDYFLTFDYLLTVEGQSDYPMPDSIYGDKIRGVIFNDGTNKYRVPKIRRKDLFEKIAVLEDSNNADSDYFHYIRNDTPGQRKFVLLPPARENSILPPMSPASTPVKRWFIRNANRIPLIGEYINPENLLPAAFDVDTGVITVDPEFPYVTGDAVQFSLKSSSFVLPSGLVEGTTYYVVRVSATRIKLSTSLALARAASRGLVSGDRIQEEPTGAIDGINCDFELSETPVSDASVIVYLDGIFQTQGVHYTIDGTTITFMTAPLADAGGGEPQEINVTYYPESDTPTTNPTEIQEEPAGLVNDVNVTFLLSATPAGNSSVDLFVNGILQVEGTHYELSGRTITFYTAPSTGQEVDAVYDTAIVFFTSTGTGFFTMKVAATRAIILATVIDIPEFAVFVMEWVKANCLFKDGDPRLTACVAKLEEQRKQMVDTLTDREPDDDNKMEMDLSFYEEMN